MRSTDRAIRHLIGISDVVMLATVKTPAKWPNREVLAPVKVLSGEIRDYYTFGTEKVTSDGYIVVSSDMKFATGYPAGSLVLVGLSGTEGNYWISECSSALTGRPGLNKSARKWKLK